MITILGPTASGKTLCYNVPVLQSILADEASRALYLFPTKALSSDQVAELYSLIEAMGVDVKTYTYDGEIIRTYVLTDPDTGIQYLEGDRGGICPRLDRYGNVMGVDYDG